MMKSREEINLWADGCPPIYAELPTVAAERLKRRDWGYPPPGCGCSARPTDGKGGQEEKRSERPGGATARHGNCLSLNRREERLLEGCEVA